MYIFQTPSSVSDKNMGMNNRKPATGPTAPAKRKAQKPPVDPNAPKRPANPFFQFCQEQRSIVLENLVSLGQGEPTKQEVTKHLATKWNALTTDDKKVLSLCLRCLLCYLR